MRRCGSSCWGTIPIGQIIGGLLATAIGARGALIVGGVLGCFAFIPILFSSVRSLEKIPTPVGPEAELGDPLLGADADMVAPHQTGG